ASRSRGAGRGGAHRQRAFVGAQSLSRDQERSGIREPPSAADQISEGSPADWSRRHRGDRPFPRLSTAGWPALTPPREETSSKGEADNRQNAVDGKLVIVDQTLQSLRVTSHGDAQSHEKAVPGHRGDGAEQQDTTKGHARGARGQKDEGPHRGQEAVDQDQGRTEPVHLLLNFTDFLVLQAKELALRLLLDAVSQLGANPIVD